MTERSNKLDEISHQLNEHILAVKGTLGTRGYVSDRGGSARTVA